MTNAAARSRRQQRGQMLEKAIQHQTNHPQSTRTAKAMECSM